MTDLKKLGAVLYRKHKKEGCKVKTEANMAGIQPIQLSNVFDGKPGNTFPTLEKACNNYGVTIKFFDGETELIL